MELNLSHFVTSKQVKELRHDIDSLRVWILVAILTSTVTNMAVIIGAAIVVDLKLSGL